MESRGMIGREKEGWREGVIGSWKGRVERGGDRELEGKGGKRDGRERDDGGRKREAKIGR